jgi:fatty acid desaturase
LGEIVFWTIIRAALVIPAVWILQGYLDLQLWWIVSIIAIYGIIVHPSLIHYRLFEDKNKEIVESTLCSTCRHFDKSAVLCMKHDKHPTKAYLPCEGMDWEIKTSNVDNEEYI